MIDRHFMRLRARDEIGPDEEAAIRAAASAPRDVPRRQRIVKADTLLDVSIILLEGIVCRYKDLANGERQITELHVPGDFIDLHSFTLKRLEHDILSLTPSRISMVRHDDLRRITERFPHLTRVYWFSTNLDAAIHREWALSLGRRTGLARVAHLFCELYLRLRLVGLTEGFSYRLEITQTDLAECLGLTPIHVNRMLRQLRELGLMTFRGGLVEIANWPALQREAEFNPSYLYLDRQPE